MQDLNGSKRPYVIAIANEKGGVGKSTSTLALGTLLAQRGFKVLFIDLDPQGNLTLSLGFKPQDMPPLSDALNAMGTSLANDFLETETENLDLIFARSLIVDNAYRLRLNVKTEAHLLSQDLRSLVRRPYNYILIDCPPSLGQLTMEVLLASNFLVIPTQADFFSAYALKAMMELIGQVRREGNPDLLYRILITLFDRRNQVQHSIKNQLKHTFGSGLFGTVIEVDAELRRASLLGFPTRSTRGVKQYRTVLDELLDYIPKTQTP